MKSTNDPGVEGDGGGSSSGTSAYPRTKYLSDMTVVDYDHESGTGEYDKGVRPINGRQYGHSVALAAGCQNDDGGDYWIDFAVGQGWKALDGDIGVSDASSVDSSGSYEILDAITQQKLTTGQIRAGAAVAVHVDMTGVTRLHVFMNDPNAPHQACGFVHIHTALVLGNFQLSK